MKHEIKQRTLTIKNQSVVERIISEDINHLKLEMIADNGICVVVKYPDYKKELTFGKHWINIYKARPGIQIRTPRILRPYSGKCFDLFEEKIHPEERELFRMRPIGFEMDVKIKDKEKEIISAPYFSKTGFCVFPKKYVKKFVGYNVTGSNLSFHKTGITHIEEGILLARITKEFEYGNLSFPLYPYGKKFRTRPMSSLIRFITDQGKALSGFYYEKTFYSEKSKCNLIIFREADEHE